MIKLFPSLMSANILELKEEIAKLEPYSDGFHLDIMDFHFVPNLTFGPNVINAIAKASSKAPFVHLMVEYPEKMVDFLQLPENSIIAFHKTSTPKPTNLIKTIHKKGWLASIALDPDESIENVTPILHELDQVLVMSVRPGFAGQEFIPQTLDKVKKLKTYRKKNKLNFRIAIDGGINEKILPEVVKAGADDIAMASAIFKAKDPVKELKKLRKIAKES
ncbi:TPA: ribulose-phosphate 3-epimerase [Candidatus Dependentiae bacterium]|nr:ribulose-phosphate 3-epimerase [Candidatus Dependentiae bacterium]HCU00373.1 ribulose-phosphate 3-epimerase [Candidatus Dependentiae bacterium]